MSLQADVNEVMRWLYTPDFTSESPHVRHVRGEVEALLNSGWSKKDAAAYARCFEEVTPSLSEVYALARMKAIRDRVEGGR